ncbi:FAD-dependent oxidoreductase [Mycolicibacterium baixiangningiae]|uniref:FAD-dependent oxidoreductase n=1 Tax=Mycolicibacterium baixiangningiae TaxID=2761578 RepID=UPI0018D16E5A|nr:FAD-dependent oxidoreductase [Mycolicibacterium baixiangningiae]
MTDTDVIVVGAGPTGLMLAAELRLAGVGVVVLERRPRINEVAKAGGLGGQILHVLRYRGLLERFEAASGRPRPTPQFPFGGLHVDFTRLAEPPMEALLLPQPRIEAVLEEYVRECGADVRRGHEVLGLDEDPAEVSVDVRGPDGAHRVSARYVVGCDGVRSRVRDLAGIAFTGVSYPEVNRLAHVTRPPSVTLREDGDYEAPGIGLLRSGYTQTDHGMFAIASMTPDELTVYTSEEDPDTYDDEIPMTVTELADSIRRVLGADLPLGEPITMTRFTYHARHAERYRAGRILLAGDAAHRFPAGGVAVNAGMLDAVNLGWKLAADVAGWAPTGLVDTYHDERHRAGARTLMHTQAQVALRRGADPAAEALRELLSELLLDEDPVRRIGRLIAGSDVTHPTPGLDQHPLVGTFAPDLPLRTAEGTTTVATLMHTARPVLLDLADREALRETARGWQDRVEIVTARTDPRPADALLIRPDAHIAWATDVGEPHDTAGPALRDALTYWFG